MKKYVRNHNARQRSISRMGIMLFCIGWFCLSSPAHAAVLTPLIVDGIADIADEASENWQELLLETHVEVGKQLRTDFGALVDLEGDDGSFFSIGEATELLVQELEFDAQRQIRIVHLAILTGLVTAEAMHLDYTTNIFELETPTVVASFKFSKATVGANAAGDSQITMETGKFDMSRENSQDGEVLANHKSKDDVVTAMQIPNKGRVDVETKTDGLAINNTGNRPLTVMIGGQPVELPAGGSMETATQDGKLSVKNTGSGNISAGGQSVAPGGSAGGLPVETVGECCQQCQNQPSAADIAQAACKAAPSDCDKIKDAVIKAAPEAAAQIRAMD